MNIAKPISEAMYNIIQTYKFKSHMVSEPKSLRRNSTEYQELKSLKAGYNNAMRTLFLNRPDWKKLSRQMGILNIPTLIDDRLRLQAEIKRTLSKA